METRVLINQNRSVKAATVLLCLVVAGCGLFGGKEAARPCPPVLLLEDARELTKFRPGPGRDITDIEYEARLVDFTGSCEYDDDEAEVELRMAFLVEQGPAAKKGPARFKYFVAIPRFHPKPEGKRIFDVSVEFKTPQRRVIHEEELELKIPIPAKMSSSKFEVYIGIQLSREQLDFNKARRRR